MDWELISQQNQTQINKDYICKKRKRVNQVYKVRDKVMLDNDFAKKY